MQVTVEKAKIATENSDKIQGRLDKIDKEIDSIWQGMDYLSNPYRGE
jgi:tetrahydromethanopterin S-methyltransferase subunit G